jgi:hypothetical protein
MNSLRDDRALSLLADIDTRGPLSVRTLLSTQDCCESDLHGLCAELRAAGLLAETEVAGERGYRTTERASEVLDAASCSAGHEG